MVGNTNGTSSSPVGQKLEDEDTGKARWTRNTPMDWKKLQAMGEQIAGLTSWSLQRDLILTTLVQLFDCQAELWTIEPVQLLPGEEKPEAEPPLTRLAKEALKSRQLTWSGARKTSLAVPLITQDTLLGIIQIKRPARRPFLQEEIDYLEALAAYASVAIQVTRQAAIKNWRFEQLNLFRSVSFQIANVLDLDELARRVTHLILNTFKYYYVAIFTLEPGETALHFRASARAFSQGEQPLSFNPALGEGIVGHVAQTGTELEAGQVAQNNHYRAIDGLPETQSEVALPIKIESRLLGVLDVQSDQPHAFHEIDLMVLRSLADNIALAVEGTRLYDALNHRVDQISTVAEVSRVLASILDLDMLSKEVVNLIQKRFGYPFVYIFTVHPGRRKVFFQAGSGSPTQASHSVDAAYDLDDPDGIVPWVARNGKTELINDVSQDARYQLSPWLSEATRAEMTLPLIMGNEILGVLDIQSDRKDAFYENDRSLFEAFADNLAIAMRNATLYRSERWRRQVAESLRDVAGLLSGNTALSQVLESILTELERNLPCDVAGIWLVEDESSLQGRNRGIPEQPRLHLAAVHGNDNRLIQDYQIPDEINSWLYVALKTEQPTIRSPKDPLGPLGAALNFPQDYSAITVPLMAGNRSLGILALAHHTQGRYGSEARGMTATFASYAAVAIENARLYASSQEQAWISTVLLQVAEATQSITTIDELASVVVRLAPLLVGVKGCALFLWDEETEAFVLNSAYGVNPVMEGGFTHPPVYPGTNYAFDQLIATRQPVTIDDPTTELSLPESITQTLGDGSLVLIPLITHASIQGTFLITKTETYPGSSPFSTGDQRLSIIQGIAQQTAVAIENIHLLEGKQEEAYVTAVLLQVAQAVVSMNDLDEILEAIIHIMPILVGIDRCIIYLWDNEAGLFHSTHSHCKSTKIDEEVRAHPFRPGDFPLLDAVWQKGTPVVCPVDQASESPLEWKSLAIFELDKARGQLGKQHQSMVMGFPLLVKGASYGIMLAQDASSRFNERRLEIISGIAQQAALAIQNDLLQKEMVGRERLEREFQLAREIQETFLPNQLPTIPGWDLDARWYTARQVGGDFYDIFELPGDRIGLVIADVSDKGMPAALYMTVTRTLIRASILDIESPAKVLEHVNDMLLMNNENGMFVTAIYAILNFQTGELIYANAGHNQPLVLHETTGAVECLAKGGTALGVIEEIHLKDHVMSLEPNGCILLYTDGATETFSPEGELFGEERLIEVAHRSIGSSAKELLNHVDEALVAFRQNEPTSDDTTLLALRRRETVL